MPILVVRHADAGDRWEDDDSLRPLTRSGRRQADRLVAALAHFPITAAYSSPFLRCVQTIEPLARARGLTIKTTPALAEGAGLEAAMELIAEAPDAVFSTHGDIVGEIVGELAHRGLVPSEGAPISKGSTWVIELEGGTPVSATYMAPPR